MAPVDIIISIIERKQKALSEKKVDGKAIGVEYLKAEGGFEALKDLKDELEGFKKLFS